MSEVIFMLLSDVDRILRLLYRGERPAHVRYLICACGRVANLTIGDAEAIGWQLLPHPKCPSCLEQVPYQGPARERYLALVEQLLERKSRCL